MADNTATTGEPNFGTITSQNYNHIEARLAETFAAMAMTWSQGTALGALATRADTFTHLPGGASIVLNTIPNGNKWCGLDSGRSARIGPSQRSGCEKGSVEVSKVLHQPLPNASATSHPQLPRALPETFR